MIIIKTYFQRKNCKNALQENPAYVIGDNEGVLCHTTDATSGFSGSKGIRCTTSRQAFLWNPCKFLQNKFFNLFFFHRNFLYIKIKYQHPCAF